MTFIDRERELSQLNAVFQRHPPQFMVVYGRRRIGKTVLLTHWMNHCLDGDHLYWVAHKSSSEILLRSFSDALGRMLPTPSTALVFIDWEAALTQMFYLARERQLVVVLDEFPYLIESVPAIPSLLQKLWDQLARGSKLMLILCGSHYHMMQEQFLSPRQPLYGRSTASLLLEEIDPEKIRLFLSRYSSEQVVETYSVVGGVPKYLELWDDRIPVLRNVEELILSPVTLFHHEALYLIQDEIAEPRTYLAILETLGAGLKTPATLAKETGIAINHIGKYLHTLVMLRIIRRILSEDVDNRKQTRISRYEIRDPFLRFYFNFIYRHPELIEQNRVDRLSQLIHEGFARYVGHTGYEELARRRVVALGDGGELPFLPEYIGRAWNKTVEIDLVAINWNDRSVLLGECKWQRAKMNVDALENLRQRADRLPRLADFKKHYALFSRAGFTQSLQKQATDEHILLFQGADNERIN